MATLNKDRIFARNNKIVFGLFILVAVVGPSFANLI